MKILITTYRGFGCLDNQYFPYVQFVRRLSDTDSVSLFLANSAQVTEDDVLEFIQADQNYPYERILPNFKASFALSKQPTVDQVGQLRAKLREPRHKSGVSPVVFALSLHDMFQQICGNPFSIVLIAAIHQNPWIKKANGNGLIEIYNRVKSEEKHIVVEEVTEEGDQSKQNPRLYRNNCSLRVSTEMSVNLLNEHHS